MNDAFIALLLLRKAAESVVKPAPASRLLMQLISLFPELLCGSAEFLC